MKRTIIYVFGPRRLSAKYFANDEITQQEGGWLKIGQTSEEDETKDKWDCAMNRIKGETHTGIPEVCQLYDVFEYPYKNGNNDDLLRSILAEDIYQLECSKLHNHFLEKYEIKAGREFVYGVSRNQVLNAVAKYERNLILDFYKHDEFDYLMQLIQKNNAADEESITPNIDDNSAVPTEQKSEWGDHIWERVIEKLDLDVNITTPKGRPYIYFKSKSKDMFSYSLGYSVRYGTTTVSIETNQGESAKELLNSFISDNNISTKIPDLKMRQGKKNKEKWTWSVCDTLEKSDNEIIDWFVYTLILFYHSFEN